MIGGNACDNNSLRGSLGQKFRHFHCVSNVDIYAIICKIFLAGSLFLNQIIGFGKSSNFTPAF